MLITLIYLLIIDITIIRENKNIFMADSLSKQQITHLDAWDENIPPNQSQEKIIYFSASIIFSSSVKVSRPLTLLMTFHISPLTWIVRCLVNQPWFGDSFFQFVFFFAHVNEWRKCVTMWNWWVTNHQFIVPTFQSLVLLSWNTRIQMTHKKAFGDVWVKIYLIKVIFKKVMITILWKLYKIIWRLYKIISKLHKIIYK